MNINININSYGEVTCHMGTVLPTTQYRWESRLYPSRSRYSM